MSAPGKRPAPYDCNHVGKNRTAVALADSLKALANTAIELHTMADNARADKNYDLERMLREAMPMNFDTAASVEQICVLVDEAYGG